MKKEKKQQVDLKKYLFDKGMTLCSASKKCKLGKNNLSRWYSGEVEEMAPKNWVKFKEVIGISRDEICRPK